VEGDGPLTLRVVSLPKNLLGPWHDPNRPRGRAWIPMWYGPVIRTSPQPGERYDLLDRIASIPVLQAVALITGVSEELMCSYRRITTLPVLPASKVS
jgi:hypothetical protein